MRPLRVTLLALALVLPAATARAEEKLVTLKNGTRLVGEVENEKGPVVTIRTKNGPVRVPLNLIATIGKPAAPVEKKPAPPAEKAKEKEKKADADKPKDAAKEPTPTTQPATSGTVAPVATPTAAPNPLEARYAVVAQMPPGPDRTRAILHLTASVPADSAAEYLSAVPPGPLSPAALVAIDSLVEQGAPAREALLARLKAQNDCAPALFAALERLWDKKDAVEDALLERLGQDCTDHAANLATLAARGTRRSIPQIVDVLFFYPEESGLTWYAQLALREIAKRDSAADEALEPLLKHIQPGWPGPDQLVRRRDVILAMGGSSGAAVPYLESTLASLPADDLDPRGSCWLSLARIGTKEATALLLRAFQEGRLPDKAEEAHRVALLTAAVIEAKGAGSRPDFLLGVAAFADGLPRPEQKRALLLALDRASGQRFDGDAEAVRRFARALIEKGLNDPR